MWRGIYWAMVAMVILSGAVPSLADDLCGGEQGRRAFEATARARLAQAERPGMPGPLYRAYHELANNECASSALIAKAKQEMPKLGREAAKRAEAGGNLYAKGTPQASAFHWWEEIHEFAEGDRIMLQAVHADPKNLVLFRDAWAVDQLSGPRQGRGEGYTAPVSYRRELERVANQEIHRLLAAEEADATGLSGSVMAASLAASKSLDKIRQAAEWMQVVSGNATVAKARAEQRGDALMRRGDPGLVAGLALPYYEFAGSPKAAKVTQQVEQRQRSLEHSAERMEESMAEKSEADQKRFNKGTADLEKELGF